MYRVILKDNFKDLQTYDIHVKDAVTREEAESIYEDLFPYVKSILVEEFQFFQRMDPDNAAVLKQIADVINELAVHEEIELKAKEETFLTAGHSFLEYNFVKRHLVVQIEEINA